MSRTSPPTRTLTLALALAASASALAAPAADGTCSVRKTGPAPTVVELYTSEGCSSCPPAEAWLNGLKGRTDVLPLAFHVNYWDNLGWPDRFASPEATDRQRRLANLDGQRGVYTPQVRVSGRDWRRWPDLPAAAGAATATAAPALELARDGDAFVMRVDATARGGALAGYWAVLEDEHETRVRAGENAGATLRHHHVVRLYRPVADWPAGQAHSARLAVSRGVPAHPRRVAFVLVDAASQRPLQAAVLAC